MRPRPEMNDAPNVLIFLVVLPAVCDRTRYLKCVKQVPFVICLRGLRCCQYLPINWAAVAGFAFAKRFSRA